MEVSCVTARDEVVVEVDGAFTGHCRRPPFPIGAWALVPDPGPLPVRFGEIPEGLPAEACP
jgi:hypothetical protein